MVSLAFRLDVEDGWPPVDAECLPFIEKGNTYEAIVAPFFVKGLSVGDVIRVVRVEEEQVLEWKHGKRSDHSTVWLLRVGSVEVEPLLPRLHELRCSTAWSKQCGVCAVDVPGDVNLELLDQYLDQLEKNNLQ